ncbi:MAG: mechanosensitive ion channel family protein [Acidimicrobiia bacterium]|nr:mechanosensitive ion channel family protein [Acidimicrobiia bacterium]NNC74636.1 mechanosensitive ion channel family protein [Acidimicrobiia bacterium]
MIVLGQTLWERVEDYVPEVLGTLGILVGFWILYRVVKAIGLRLVDRMKTRLPASARGIERGQRLDTLWAVARSTFAVVVFVVAVLTIMIVWGIPTAPLVAVGSVVGVAVGFGAQNFIRDVISGFLITAEDQYSIGDVVRLAGVSGGVEEIRLRTTVLRDLDGNVHVVPNGAITVATNLTQEYAQVVLDLGVAYKEDIDRVIAVIRDELRSFAEDAFWEPHIVDQPDVLGVNELGDSAVVVRVVVRIIADQRWAAKRELLRRFKVRFDAEGIEIPFPHRQIIGG